MEKSNWLYLLMPSFGASIHIVQKFLFECTSVGSNSIVHKFQKPFFYTWLGSCGLFSIFLFNLIANLRLFFNKFLSSKLYLKPFLKLGISTFFNLVAGTLSNVSSLYLDYSVSLMLRSSTLIFGGLISKYYLHKPLQDHQFMGIIFTLIAIFLVSLSALLSNSKTTHKTASNVTIAIFVIVRIMSKSLQAISMIIEEKVMDSMNLSPSEVSGLSGIWSFMFSTFLLLTMEDTYDTIIMIKNNSIILILSIVSIAIFAIWTILSLKITQNASAIARMVFDQLTIAIVWIIQIFIHWIITGTEYEEKYAKAGEEWTKWSWLQMVGFAVMVFGAYVYQGIVKIPARKQTDTERLLQNNDPPLI